MIKKILALEKADKVILFLSFTAFINCLMAVVKFIFSITLPSLWFFVNAIFSIVLTLVRIFSIKSYRKMKLEKNKELKARIGYKNYLNNGVLLILLGIAYFSISVYMYYKGTNTTMHEYITYLVALIAFYSIGSAIYGMCKYKKSHNPILSAVKTTNFANALTSIVLTQVVLLDTFGNNVNSKNINGYVGMLVSLIIVVLGLYMILGIRKYVYKIKTS